ncbi:MAG: rhodanese-like domain-containing protein [Kiritimatiellales bacterium]|nr:rhodanese-like domain-containing protein [Kiritimatiellales bacterium]
MNPLAKQIGLILLASAALAVAANLGHPRRIPWVQNWGRQMEAHAAKEKIEAVPLYRALDLLFAGNHLFIDARPAAEYLQGRIKGAVSLPFGSLAENLETLERLLETQRPLVVYCRNRECDDALMLALELRDMGKSNLVLYVDGFELWEQAAAPVEGRP